MVLHLSQSPILSLNATEEERATLRCEKCGIIIDAVAERCELCEAVEKATRSRTLISRIKSKFGFELSTGLVTLTIEEPDLLFSEKDIDQLLDRDNMVPLDTKDVPNWEIMFFSKKRVKKPMK
ncbi:MAG: hypothetical protein HKN33_06325 [Pyrinomonadaceae bacterium]|nr:hypothetical protein [Pyrinomonadaceae bacterium]